MKRYTELQSYFDDAITYLALMPKQAVIPTDAQGITAMLCAYQTEDNRHCIIGQFIPDNHPAMHEQVRVADLIELYPNLIGVAIPDHKAGLALATELQFLHDVQSHWNNNGFKAWDRAEQIATSFDLEFMMPSMTLADIVPIQAESFEYAGV